MNDEVSVGEVHRLAHHAEQLEAARDREPGGPAVDVERLAVDVLHDEVRIAVAGAAAVDQPRDVGMGQRRQDLALLREALQDLPRLDARADHLDGNAVVAVAVWRRQVDDAGLALADLAEQPVTRDAVADAHRRARQLEEPAGARICGEQRLDVAADLGVAALASEQRGALARRAGNREPEQPLDLGRRLRHGHVPEPSR